MPSPLRIAFLGCGFITRVHSRNLRRFRSEIVCGYASRDKAKAAAFCGEYRGTGSYSDYSDAINDPNVDAVVIAVPPKFHLNLTLQALSAGKHVLVEKPAYPDDRRLPGGARGARQREASRARRRERSLQAARHQAAPVARRWRDRRHGLRPLQQHRQAPEDRGRLAQRRVDGRRRCVLRRRHPLAAPGREPWTEDHLDPRLPAGAVERRPRQARQEHDGRRSTTTTAPSARCITRARSRRC